MHKNQQKGSAKFLTTLFILILLVAGGYVLYDNAQYQHFLSTPASQDASLAKRITIPSGASVSQVSLILTNEGIISDAATFSRYVRSQGWETAIQAGDYVLKPSTLIPNIASRLAGKTTSTARVTIPEGYTVRQINALLQEKGLVKGDEFLDCLRSCPLPPALLSSLPNRNLEGFLFPETYLVDPDAFDVTAFVRDLVDQTFDVLSPYRAKISSKNRSLYETVIMASMVEKETITDEERPIVAGILWKRLDAGWFLGVDATTRYANDDWENPITADQLAEDNPYNTRKKKGLPPTPICNPGEKSIAAAVSPQDSPYWYYLHDKQGKVHYARTQEEHDLNRERYLKNL